MPLNLVRLPSAAAADASASLHFVSRLTRAYLLPLRSIWCALIRRRRELNARRAAFQTSVIVSVRDGQGGGGGGGGGGGAPVARASTVVTAVAVEAVPTATVIGTPVPPGGAAVQAVTG